MTNSPVPLNLRGGNQSPLKPIADHLLKLIGWHVEGPLPAVEKFILIVAPHTSNWDVPVGYLCGHSLELLSRWRYGFMAKASVFKEPLGTLMRWLGGIPINRSAASNVVEQMVEVFQRYERLMLVITPEGTRKRTEYWKSGFYRIARGAGVPIVPALMDYKLKLARLGAAMWPTGHEETDLNFFREFYAGATGKIPGQFGAIQFRPEAG